MGFAGAMFVVKPTPSAFDVWAVVAIAAATSSALREMLTRRIDRSVPTVVIAFMGSIGILVAGALFAATGEWRPIPARDLAMLAGAAIFVGIATYSIALAFRGVDLSVVAPFRYSYLITSAIAGYLVFNELPDRWSAAGAVLIVGSGLYALHREAVRRREITAKATPAAYGQLSCPGCAAAALLLLAIRFERIFLEDVLAVVDLFVSDLRGLVLLVFREPGRDRGERHRSAIAMHCNAMNSNMPL